jgi:hypothetical protein
MFHKQRIYRKMGTQRAPTSTERRDESRSTSVAAAREKRRLTSDSTKNLIDESTFQIRGTVELVQASNISA